MKVFITLLEIIFVVCVACVFASNFGVERLKEIKMYLYILGGLSFVLSYFLKKQFKK
ncbi:hypothetical protein [Gottfriedia acidiceleris]|uniref:hypothetical protein n=1 Tax=Gottfriedia acidiceleris TaxID=371036 RepID=UPI003000928F